MRRQAAGRQVFEHPTAHLTPPGDSNAVQHIMLRITLRIVTENRYQHASQCGLLGTMLWSPSQPTNVRLTRLCLASHHTFYMQAVGLRPEQKSVPSLRPFSRLILFAVHARPTPYLPGFDRSPRALSLTPFSRAEPRQSQKHGKK